MDYQILRSERKTVVIQVETDGTVTVRAPKRCSFRKIDNFVREKEHWIRTKQEEIAVNRKKFSEKKLTEKERESLRQKAGILSTNDCVRKGKISCNKLAVSIPRIS